MIYNSARVKYVDAPLLRFYQRDSINDTFLKEINYKMPNYEFILSKNKTIK